MSKYSTTTLLIINIFLTVTAMTTIVSIRTVNGGVSSWEVVSRGRCGGTVAECMDGELEMMMNAEIKRRVLATTQYISYDALQRNTVPCSQRGASYYNCKSGSQANPYSRGCTTITRCRS